MNMNQSPLPSARGLPSGTYLKLLQYTYTTAIFLTMIASLKKSSLRNHAWQPPDIWTEFCMNKECLAVKPIFNWRFHPVTWHEIHRVYVRTGDTVCHGHGTQDVNACSLFQTPLLECRVRFEWHLQVVHTLLSGFPCQRREFQIAEEPGFIEFSRNGWRIFLLYAAEFRSLKSWITHEFSSCIRFALPSVFPKKRSSV